MIDQKITPHLWFDKAAEEAAAYPFSKRFGWVEDRNRVSWQIVFAEAEFTN